MIDLGDSYTNGFEVRARPVYPATSGVLTTPSSSSCTITLPDGTTVSGTLTTVATGVLRLDYPTTQAGRHTGRLVTVNPDSAHTFEFDVDAAPTGIVSLAEVRSRLNFSATTSDEEVRFYIAAATDYIEGIVGPVVRQSLTRTVTPAANGQIFLDGPAISLTSMTDPTGYGWTYDTASYLFDTAGVISPLYGTAYPRTGSPVTVTYVAGYAVVPALIREAALDYIDWAWRSQRGPSGSPFQGEAADFPDLTTPTPPYKIAAKLQRYVVPSIA